MPDHPHFRSLIVLVAFPILCLLGLFALPTSEAEDGASTPVAGSDDFAIVGARVFDGATTLSKADVWVRDGRIHGLGEGLDLPADLRRIDGSGHTLMPGLIDSHVHSWGTAREDAARFGVTALLDQFTAISELTTARTDRDAGGATDRADLFSAGTLATADGGHGTQYGVPVPTVDNPESAAAWVQARRAEGSDWIKIVVERGWGQPLPTLDFDTVGALIDAAHAAELLAVVHVSKLDDALEVARRGADGLVHVWNDRVPNEEEVAELLDSGIFLVPTLVVLEGMADPTPSMTLAEAVDDRLAPAQRQSLGQRFPGNRHDPSNAIESVRRLAVAGVPILAGSDAPNPATAMGMSLHRELALLASAGLSPESALAAATSLPAKHFRVPDRGRIEIGALADLVLVEGDPTTEIDRSWRQARVWKSGRQLSLEPPATASVDAAAVTADQTLLADFETGLDSRFGAGWSTTTDQRMGGKSQVEISLEDGALRAHGELKPGAPFPWAGALVFLGPERMAAVDLSERKVLSFRVRGRAGTTMAMVFSGSMQGIPPNQPFTVTETWTTVELQLDAFTGFDPSTWRAISWNAVGAPGTFWIEIDDVEIR